MPDIDNRIVGLQFDNAKFESGVKQSIKSIDELNKGLEFKNAGKGFSDIQKAADSVNLSKIASAVEQLSERFSVMGIIGMRVLTNIADGVMRFGKNLVTELTTIPMASGMQEYESIVKSTQTLMNATGESIEAVTETLDTLNKYSDDTIYAFRDMTENMGSFVNNGIGLKDTATMMQGIGNLAALSGASTWEASISMRNFADAAALGHMSLMDWRSISRVGKMGTMEFKNVLIQTAEELAVLDKGQKEVTATNFNETLKEQWLTTEVLTTALAKYTDETTDLGQRAAKAAKEVKTFSMMVGTLKESLQSGWAQTWRGIFGDYKEATPFWTGIKDQIEAVISQSTDARLKIIQEWRDSGGRDNMVYGVAHALTIVRSVLDTISGAWQSVFGKPSADFLLQLSSGFRKVGENILRWLGDPLADGSTRLQKIGKVLEGVFSVFKIAGTIISAAWTAVTSFLGALNIPAAASAFLDWLVGIANSIGEFAKNLNIGEKISTWFSQLGVAVAPLFGMIASVGQTVISFFSSLWSSFAGSDEVTGAWTTLSGFFKDIPAKVTAFVDSLKGRSLGDILKGWVVSFIAGIPAAIQKVSDAITGFWETLFPSKSGIDSKLPKGARLMASTNPMMMMSDGFTKDTSFLGIIKSKIDEWKTTISEWFSSLWTDITSNETIISAGDSIKTWFTSLFRGDEVKNYTKSATGEMVETIGYMPGKIEMALTALWGQIQNIPAILVDLAVKLMTGLPGVLQSIGGFFSEVWKSFNIKEKFKGLTDGLAKWIRENVPQPILDAFAGISNFLAPITERVKGFIAKVWQSINDIFNNDTGNKEFDALSFLDKLKLQFQSTDGVKSYFAAVWEKIKASFDKVKAWFKEKIGGLIAGIKDLFSGKEKGLYGEGGSEKLLPVIENGGFLSGVKDFLMSLWTGLGEITTWLGKFSNQFNLAAFVTTLTIIAGIWSAISFFFNIGRAAKTLAKSKLKQETSIWMTAAGQIILIAGAIFAIAGLMYAIGKTEEGTFSRGARVVGIIAVAMLGIMTYAKFMKMDASTGISFITMAGSVILILFAIEKLMGMFKKIVKNGDTEYFVAAVVGVMAIVAALAMLMKFIGGGGGSKIRHKVSAKFDWKGILALAIGFRLIANALKPFANMNGDELLKMGAVLVGITAAIAVLLYFSKDKKDIDSSSKTNWKSIIAAAASIWLVAEALKPFAKMSPGELENVGKVLLGIFLAVAGLTSIQRSKTEISGMASTLISALGAVAIIWAIGEALKKIENVPTDTVEIFLEGVGRILAILAGKQILGNLTGHTWESIIVSAVGDAGAFVLIQKIADELVKIHTEGIPVDAIETFTYGVAKILRGTAAIGLAAGIAGLAGFKAVGVTAALGALATIAVFLLNDKDVQTWLGEGASALGDVVGLFTSAKDRAYFDSIAGALDGIKITNIDPTSATNLLAFLKSFNETLKEINTVTASVYTENGGNLEAIAAFENPAMYMFEALEAFGRAMVPLTKAIPFDFDISGFSTKVGSALEIIPIFRDWITKFNTEASSIAFQQQYEAVSDFQRPSTVVVGVMSSIGNAMATITDAVSVLGSTEEFTKTKDVAMAFINELAYFIAEFSLAATMEGKGYNESYDLGILSTPKVYNDITTLLDTVTVLGQKMKTFASDTRGLSSGTLASDTGTATGILRSVKTIMEEFAGLGEFNTTNYTTAVNSLSSMGYQVRTFMSQVTGDAPVDASMFSELATGLSTIMGGLGGLLNVTEGLESNKKSVSDAINTIFSSAFTDLEGGTGAGNLTAVGVWAANKIAGGVSGGYSPTIIATSVSDLLESISTNVEDVPATVSAALKTLGEKLVAWLINGLMSEAAIAALTSSIGRLLGKMATASYDDTYYGQMYSAGAWYARGLANGLWSEVDEVRAAAKALADAITSTTNKSLAVASPSKKGIKTGGFYGEGLQLGIYKSMRPVQKAALTLAKTMLKTTDEELGIHSPSEAAIWRGIQVDKGYAIGLHAGLPSVTKGIKKLNKVVMGFVPKELPGFGDLAVLQAQQDKKGFAVAASVIKKGYSNTKGAGDFLLKTWDSAIAAGNELLTKGETLAMEMLGQFLGDKLEVIKNLVDPAAANDKGGKGGGGGGGGGGGSTADRAAGIAVDDMSRKDMMLNLEQQFDKIAQKLDMLGGMSVVLDDNTLVGKMLPAIDQGLGRSITLEGRM